MQIDQLNQTPFRQFRGLFSSLSVPKADSIRGRYRAAFVGPTWLRTCASPALSAAGLSGWWGKEFQTNGTAMNIVFRAGQYSTCFPMKFVEARSFIDGVEGLALYYQPGNPFPWRLVVDEIRRLDESTLLGMTLANINGLRGLAFPFILQKEN